MSTHQKWFQDLAQSDNKSSAAAKAGIPVSTLTFQLRNDSLAASTVIALARAYGREVIQALAETGIISDEEATTLPASAALTLAKDSDLIAELARRLPDLSAQKLDTPLGDLADLPGVDVVDPVSPPVIITDTAEDRG